MFGIDEKALRVTWTVFLFGFLLFVVYSIRETLLVFAAAVLFAYVLSPIVSLIERFLPKRRVMALSIVYVVLLGALVGLGFALIPRLAAEATSLLTRLPALVTGGTWATLPLPKFLSWANPVRGQIMAALNRQAAGLEQHVVPFIQEASSRILSEVSSLVPMILVPIVAFFFLKDARTTKLGLLSLARGSARVKLAGIINGVHAMLQSYMKALVILAAASFLAWVIFLNIMGEPYALLLARTARDRFSATWGLSETGAAGPTGNPYGDAPGHTCIALAGPIEIAATLETGEPDRVANMRAFAKAALDMLLKTIE